MADSKITALTAISTVDPTADPLVIVDVSDTSMAASGTTKKSTINQLLGSGGTATLASATITGDLTVRTNKLAVTSTNVGIGTASPTIAAGVGLEIENAGITTLRLQNTSGANAFELQVDSDANGVLYRGYNNSPHVFYVNNSTAMTLNSTGLGVGGIVTGTGPTILVEGTAGTYAKFNSKVGAKTWSAGYRSGTTQFEIQEDGTERFVIANGGNVGIGVTPSAWDSTFKAIQINNRGAYISATSNSFSTAPFVQVGNNGYYDTTNSRWEYVTANAAAQYVQAANSHLWYTAAVGSADAEITDFATAKMTLDASGNLLVGTTSSSETSGVGHKINTSLTAPWLATVGSASTNGNITSSVYSTGAAAYRFYVGYGGTVFATNTTISAISDARLKENVQDLDVGLGAILALKPRKFDWKEGKGKNIKGDRGFIAQEFETVFPQLVDEWADPAPEGEAPYKSVRQDLIPVLVKAIQELTARVQTLEAK